MSFLQSISTKVEQVLSRVPAEASRNSQLSFFLLHRRKLATLGLVVLALFLGLRVIFGSNGALIYHNKRNQLRELQAEVERLERENRALSDYNQSLKSQPQAIEREAREQLRYAKPGEIILVLPELPPHSSASDAAAQKR